MLHVVLFWCIAITLTVIAIAFAVPAIWLSDKLSNYTVQTKVLSSIALCAFIVITPYVMYKSQGLDQELSHYYSSAQKELRDNNQQLRLLHARLQREFVKTKFDLQLDVENVDLILQFAQLHSQQQEGILQPLVQDLLQAVLKVLPKQITALNLLAVHAYKSAEYTRAVMYWQDILLQFTPDMRGSSAYKILNAKIIETQNKIKSTG